MKRAIRWAVFVAFLVAVGAFAYAVTPIAPRWSVRLDHPAMVRLFGDGRVLTMPDAKSVDRDRSGPAIVYDVTTGERLLSTWTAEDSFELFAESRNGRRIGGLAREPGNPARLRWLDLDTGREGEVRLPPALWWDSVTFAPEAAFAVCNGPWEDGVRRLAVVDLASGSVVALHRTDSLAALTTLVTVTFVGERLCYPAPDGEATVVWDVRTRTAVGLIPGTVCSADAPGCVVVHEEFGLPGGSRRRGVVTVWDVRDRPRLLLRVPVGYYPQAAAAAGRLFVSPSGEGGTHPVQVWDVPSRRKLWEHPVTGLTNNFHRDLISPDGRFAVVLEVDPAPRPARFTLLDLDNRRVVWTGQKDFTGFTPDARWVFWSDGDAEHFIDPVTGVTALTVRTPELSCSGGDHFADGGRQHWCGGIAAVEPPPGWLGWLVSFLRPRGPTGLLRCVEVPSGRILFEYRGGVTGYAVSPDGTFVIAAHQDGERGQSLKRWDVPGRKTRTWAIAVPLALGAGVLGLGRWLSRRKEEP